jgi:hypothetical protein
LHLSRLRIAEEGKEQTWHGFYQKLLYKMPTTIMVNLNVRETIEA